MALPNFANVFIDFTWLDIRIILEKDDIIIIFFYCRYYDFLFSFHRQRNKLQGRGVLAEVSQRVRGGGNGQRAGRRAPSCEPGASLVRAADGHALMQPPEDRIADGFFSPSSNCPPLPSTACWLSTHSGPVSLFYFIFLHWTLPAPSENARKPQYNPVPWSLPSAAQCIQAPSAQEF